MWKFSYAFVILFYKFYLCCGAFLWEDRAIEVPD